MKGKRKGAVWEKFSHRTSHPESEAAGSQFPTIGSRTPSPSTGFTFEIMITYDACVVWTRRPQIFWISLNKRLSSCEFRHGHGHGQFVVFKTTNCCVPCGVHGEIGTILLTRQLESANAVVSAVYCGLGHITASLKRSG